MEKKIIRKGHHYVLTGCSISEYYKMIENEEKNFNSLDDLRTQMEDDLNSRRGENPLWDYPASELEDDTIEDVGPVYVELFEEDGEARYFESNDHIGGFKPYDIYRELDKPIDGCEVERVEWLTGEKTIRVHVEHVHHLVANLVATHEYAIDFKRDLTVFYADEIAHGSWWSWDLNNLEPYQEAIIAATRTIAEKWFKLEAQLKENNK